MNHVMLNSSFTFKSGTVPGFCHAYCDTTDSVLIPVYGTEPSISYDVFLNDAQGTVSLHTEYLTAADARVSDYNEDPNHEHTRAAIRTLWELRMHQFCVIRRTGEGVGIGIAIVRGSDTTVRTLAFIGCDGGSSRVELSPDKSTASILVESCDPNSNHHTVDVVAVMDVRQRLVFTLSEPNDPNHRQLRIYTWTDDGINIETISEYQWSGYLTRELIRNVDGIPNDWTQV